MSRLRLLLLSAPLLLLPLSALPTTTISDAIRGLSATGEIKDDGSRVERALRCRFDSNPPCVTLDDELGAVESAHPNVVVIEAVRSKEQIRSTVLRFAAWSHEGVFFEYRHDLDGQVLGRSCLSTVPEEGSLLQLARKPDAYLHGRVLFYDRCTLEGACRSWVSRRVSFAVDGEARLRDPREEGPLRLSGQEDSADCVFTPHDVPLPPGPAEVESLDGGAWVRMGGETVLLRPGMEVQNREVILSSQTTLSLRIRGLSVRFDSDQDKGTRLLFSEKADLVDSWEAARVHLEEKWGREGRRQPLDRGLPRQTRKNPPVIWSHPYLTDLQVVLHLENGGARPVCQASLELICRRECEGFRQGMAPLVTSEVVLLPGPGAVYGGQC